MEKAPPATDPRARAQAALEARRGAEEEAQRRREYEAEKARQATIARSKRDAAKRAMGAGAGFGGGPASGGGAFAWKRNSTFQQGPVPPRMGLERGTSGLDLHCETLPSHDDCEMGISAMITRTQNGMKEGLTLLGLPSFPLVFVPGQDLRLCGHCLREEINAMIHAWMTDEKDEFYMCLTGIKNVVAKPLLTEEEVEMMDQKDQWMKTIGPDGQPMYTKRDAQEQEDDEEDEVIDVPPVGAQVRAVGNGPPDLRGCGPGCAVEWSTAQDVSASAPLASAASPTDEDYYALLGVHPEASLHEIRSTFRALVVTEHPEKGGDPKRFQKLNKAYSVLSDQKKRLEFDQLREGGGSIAAVDAGGGIPSATGVQNTAE